MTGPATAWLLDLALAAVRTEGVVVIPRAEIPGRVADWLDDLITRAEDDGLQLTWTQQGDDLCIVDIEA